MPRYMVERTFGEGLHIPINEDGAAVCMNVVGGNADLGVTWVHSYVSDDRNKTFWSTTALTRRRSARQPNSTACRSSESRRLRCWTRISIDSQPVSQLITMLTS